MNYPTAQVIAWLRHDLDLLRVASHIASLEQDPENDLHSLLEWMRCRMGWCELNHAASDIPERVIPSLYDLQTLLSREQFAEVDWDAVREAVK